MKAVRRSAVQFRSCPRCSGDLIPDEDGYACLQCGAQVSPRRLVAMGTMDSMPESSMGRTRFRLVLVPALKEFDDDAA